LRTTLKLVLPLIISVALVSLLFAAYQVRLQRKNLRTDLSRRAELLADSLQESIQPLFEKNDRNSDRSMQRLVDRFAQREHMQGIAVYENKTPRVVTSSLGKELEQALAAVARSIDTNMGQGEFTRAGETPMYFYAVPLTRNAKAAGALLVAFDSSYITSRVLLTLRDALLTALLETLLVSGLALLLVRWTFLDPLKRTAKWLRTLRAGETQIPASLPQGEIFDQLNREMTHLARDLGAARAAAAEEAQLRETHASVWTAERLRISLQSKLKGKPLFVVSNREPYMHVRGDRGIDLLVPASGLVTALEPVLVASDGTWVAHPGLVPTALAAFDAVMKTPNQIDRKREDVQISAADILKFGPEEPITEQGLRTNVSVGVLYLESWLRGAGCVPIFNLMEDAATAEISRAQVWQWIRHPRGVLSDGRKVTKELFRSVLEEELAKVQASIGQERYKKGKYSEAADLFGRITTNEQFAEFLTLPGYERLD